MPGGSSTSHMSATTFSKRHYEAVANVLRKTHCNEDLPHYAGWNSVRVGLAQMFKADNPKFNFATFMNACVPPSEKASKR